MKRGIYFLFVLILLYLNILLLSCNTQKVTVALMTNLNKASEIGESEV